MLSQRLSFGALLIAILLGLLYADSVIGQRAPASPPSYQLDGVIVTLVVGALVLMGSLELSRLIRTAGYRPLVGWPAVVSVILVAAPFLSASGLASTIGITESSTSGVTMAVLVAGLFGVFALALLRKKTAGAIADIAVSLWPVLYLGLFGQFILALRVDPRGGSVGLLLYFIGTVKICDIGAYFTGVAIGRHKMIPWLSPKKTWEGLIGGITASMLFAAGFTWFGDRATSISPFVSIPPALLFGLAMGALGQAGDLLESLIKRSAESKDSANVIPAFGGVLDIVDSLLITAPVAYLLLL